MSDYIGRDFFMVFTYANGQEVDCIFPCAMLQGYTTMTACEYFCSRYYRCDNIAMADDEIKEWEGDIISKSSLIF